VSLKIVIESGESEEEESYPCPNCGCECESDDKYCCQCGKKLPVAKGVPMQARMKAMNGMMEAE
jgi:hypothetical protein